MPLVPFVDDRLEEELNKKIKTNSGKQPTFPEQSFLLSSLKLGLTLNDLKQLTYVEVMKLILECLDTPENKETEKIKNATQADIDKFYGG